MDKDKLVEPPIAVSLEARVRRAEAAWQREPWFGFMVAAALRSHAQPK